MSIVSLPVSIGEDISKSIATELLNTALSVEGSLVTSLVKDVMQAVLATTSISPAEGNTWFGSVAHQLFPVEAMVIAPLLFAATIGAIFRQDMKRLGRAWAVGLPVALIGGYAISSLAFLGVSVTDSLSSVVEGEVAPHLGADFLSAVTFAINNPASGFVGDLFGLVVLLGGLAIWLELALRAAAVELAVFFMPLAFAGLVWPATAHWAKRFVELLCALLLAKPVIVGALCLGDNALTSTAIGPSSIVTGAGVLLMAAFAPVALLKLAPVAEVSAIAHLQGLSRQPFQAAQRALQQALAVAGTAAGVTASASLGPPPSGTTAQLLGQMGPEHGESPLGPAGPPPSRAAPPGPAPVPAVAATAG